ncbi:A/G-specific adenine glycosylase [Rubritalea spongiae]|uniref:Adenine DNA glycosylase n=1 Tax=Rubritalea spongiae TaxID=430797 RepID=A0ABW5E356_9BACT
MLATQDTKSFQHALLAWYTSVAKDYPWRQTTDPWHILVSEVMLQQTQVATVLGKGFYTRFLEKYPTPASIANAPEQDILSAWEGLGYYRRVRNLQKAARAICEQHKGIFPTQHAAILALPGIGQYTAGAVSSFAYNQPQPIVDANVARIFSRLFDYQERVDSSAGTKQLWQWADQLLSHHEPRLHNSALMELGQQVCSNKSPQCLLCPIKPWCQTKNPEDLPIKKARKKTVLVDELCMLAICDGKILLHKAADSARRSGMWKLPEREHHELETQDLLLKTNYAITHHKVTLYIYQAPDKTEPATGEAWHSLDSLDKLPMPSPFRKALNSLLEDYFV